MSHTIDFSVVMPVRGNIDGLRITLGSFNLFTAQRDRFEVILVVDDDDPDASFYLKLRGKFGYDIRVLIVKRSDNFSNDYYNAGAKLALGTNIMVFNDDCYMQTYGWDDIVRAKVVANPQFNGVYLVDMMDSTHDSTASYPKFPMISRKAVDSLGFFFFPQVRQWPSDKCIWDLYNGVGCVIPCHEVKMQHDHNFDHLNDPTKSKFIRILEEDKANGVFPVNPEREARILYEEIEIRGSA